VFTRGSLRSSQPACLGVGVVCMGVVCIGENMLVFICGSLKASICISMNGVYV
jgi:hypothetical protein